jgi:Zn-dependent peptidase ImmA (M78 family)
MGQAYQESLRELGTSLSASKKIFRDLNPEGLTTSQLAEQTRRYLGVSIQDQFSWRSPEQAFKYWRHALEVSSVFAFKDSFKDRYVSGFCLLDPDWPIIFVNNSNSYARQTFTLVHELGHIFFQIHGVTDIDDTYLRYMNQHDKSLEIKCNRFAAQLLVPDAVFSKEIPLVEKAGLEIIPRLADKYSVSKDVILRKLLDHRVISRESYQLKTDEWTKDYIRHMKSGAGGNYYLTKLAYLGEGFARLAFARHTAGHLNEIQLANHLNMNSANLRKLQRYARW